MDNRTNTIAGWVLAGCVTALGLSIVSGMAFHHDSHAKKGYPIEGVEEEGGAGGEAAKVPIATLLASADVARGAADFAAKCGACHTATQGGANLVGPNLWAVVGKPHGHLGNFGYSEALKSVPGNWDFDALDAWLASPRKYAPGTKMTFAGMSDGQERANVIAWLNAQGSNLPFPAAPASGEPAGNTTDNPTVDENAQPADKLVPANDTSPATGAPSVDPQAKIQAEEKAH